jgi:hypothetical protein
MVQLLRANGKWRQLWLNEFPNVASHSHDHISFELAKSKPDLQLVQSYVTG